MHDSPYGSSDERPLHRIDTVDSANLKAEPQRRHTAALNTMLARIRYFLGEFAWQECTDSNRGPSVLETDALPTELHSYRQAGI
jgi:hypothetical protein